MNKSEMADKLADRADISKGKASEIIDHIFSTKAGEGIIAVELDAGRKVNITGFGNFATKHRSARAGQKPGHRGDHHDRSEEVCPLLRLEGPKDRVAE